MKTFEWNEDYDVKVERFNEQHRHFFEIIRKLYAAIENKNDRLAMALIINDLIGYTKNHFEEEEICLQKTLYPEFEKHKKQHQAFIKKIEQFTSDYNGGKHLLHFDMLVLLKNWVLVHIAVEDKKYGDYLNEHGIF